MKKSSRRPGVGLRVLVGQSRLDAAALALIVMAGASFPAVAADYPVTPAQRATAEQVASAGVPLSEIAPDAPDVYTVVPGDTLWGISSKFLRRPYRWPELWGMNKSEIRNPHLIYPGQVLSLVRDGDRARLQFGAAGGQGGTVKLSPRVRSSETLGPIPSIPAGAIEPFLSRPLVVTESELDASPRVVATAGGHVVSGAGEMIYVRGAMPEEARNGYYLYRKAKPLVDPDSKIVLAWEAAFLGSAEQVRQGDPATFRITSATEEVQVDDRLVAASAPEYVNYAPREAAGDIEGRVMSIYGGLAQAAGNQIITLNRGELQGVERGHVYRLLHYGATITDKTGGSHDRVKLPDEAAGYVFVFRVFGNISYGLVVNSTDTVTVGDRFSSRLD